MTRVKFWHAFRSAYAGGLAFVRDCLALTLVPAAFDLLQHVVEVRIGMYDSLAAAQALADSPMRTAFGLLKVASLTLPAYWVMRFLPRRDARFAVRVESPAWQLFLLFLIVQIVLEAIDLYLLPRHGWWAPVVFLVAMVEGALFAAWAVGASWGNERMSVQASIRLMAPRLIWTLAFQVVVTLPFLVPHYALCVFAMMGAKSILWPALVVDSLLVGVMTPVTIASSFYPALRAAQLAGVALLGLDVELSRDAGIELIVGQSWLSSQDSARPPT